MNLEGLVLGAISFLIIGAFHPIVIKAEYYFGRKSIPVFAVAGAAFLAASLFWNNTYISVVLGLIGFSALWSIKEVLEQEKRVEKGWFPQNPKRERSPDGEHSAEKASSTK